MKIRRHLQIAALCCAVLLLQLGGYAAVDDPITGNTTADVTFEAGTLNLVKMDAFTFGTKTISGDVQNYPAEESKVYLEIHDLRGNGNGWRVTATAGRFLDDSDAPSLPGARITLTGGVATSNIDRTKPTVVQTIDLDTGGPSTPVATAAVGAGLGNWSIAWEVASGDNTNVTLYVPAGAATTGTHTSTITWTLINAPA